MKIHALNDSIDYIKSWLQFRYEREEIPGFIVAVSHKGKLIMNEAYGYANIEQKKKLKPTNVFRIASQSKTFTATALMQLQEKESLKIDDLAIDYLPWLKDHRDKRWQKVTIRQLMSHGAGIIRDGINADYWQLEKPFPNKQQLQDAILKSDLTIDSNVKLKYSNLGYSLLGMIIEAASGQTYADYISSNIIESLGLENTGPEYTPEIEDRLATGYTRLESSQTRLPIDNIFTDAMAPATGIYSTAEDLCRYFSAQFIGSGKLLSDESKKEMQKVQWHAYRPSNINNEDYGLGFSIEYLNQRKLISHGGAFPGHATYSIADPKDKLVVTVLINCIDQQAGLIARSLFDIIDYFQNNSSETPTKLATKRLAGRYINLFGMTDIIATGDNLVATYPDSWQPLSYPNSLERLEYINQTTLKLVDADSFYAEGELVHFNFENDEVQTIVYTGYTMWPSEVWFEKQRSRQQVQLQ